MSNSSKSSHSNTHTEESSRDSVARKHPSVFDALVGKSSKYYALGEVAALREVAVDEDSFGEVAVDEDSFGEVAVDEVAVDEVAVDEVAVDEVAVDEDADKPTVFDILVKPTQSVLAATNSNFFFESSVGNVDTGALSLLQPRLVRPSLGAIRYTDLAQVVVRPSVGAIQYTGMARTIVRPSFTAIRYV
jgi:hypothetical protein